MSRLTFGFLILFLVSRAKGFLVHPNQNGSGRDLHLLSAKGFGASPGKQPKKPKQSSRMVDSLQDKAKVSSKASPKAPEKSKNMPFVKSEQEGLLASLQEASSKTCIGKVVAASPLTGTPDADPFWEFMPSLISSRFQKVPDQQLGRVAGFVRHALDPNLPLEDSIVQDPYRRHDEMHAYMPGLGPTKPFHDPAQVKLCRLMSENYETIRQEYDALVEDMESGSGKDRFQSVTSMNYESGWKTLVLFYNGHRIPNFPYHLCPTTTRILETVPLAGRIAGFNRQQPGTGIPLHTDGNNMWLTGQMVRSFCLVFFLYSMRSRKVLFCSVLTLCYRFVCSLDPSLFSLAGSFFNLFRFAPLLCRAFMFRKVTRHIFVSVRKLDGGRRASASFTIPPTNTRQ
jgi:hypothetical protein